MRIDLPLFDLSIDRMIEAIAHYIELKERHFIYHIHCHIEKQPDKSEGEFKVKAEYVYYNGLFLKSHIIGVELEFVDSGIDDDRYDTWVVELTLVGETGTRIRIKCETEAFAQSLLATLQEYILK